MDIIRILVNIGKKLREFVRIAYFLSSSSIIKVIRRFMLKFYQKKYEYLIRLIKNLKNLSNLIFLLKKNI